MGNVGERSSVDKDGSTLECLHEGRLDGVLHQDGHGTGTSNVFGGDGITGLAGSDDHSTKSCSHIGQIFTQGENSHALGGDGDIESSLSRESLFGIGLTHSDGSKVSVIGVENSVPGEGSRVDIETCKLGGFLLGQVVGLGLVDTELLQTGEHGLGKDSLALLSGY